MLWSFRFAEAGFATQDTGHKLGASNMNYKGSCHCGQISFEVEGTLEQAMECNCSHCSRKGYLLWFVPRPQFKLLTAEEDLVTYTFNKHVIKHHFCPKCGCAPFASGKDLLEQRRQQ
jgi:hypothetical protein